MCFACSELSEFRFRFLIRDAWIHQYVRVLVQLVPEALELHLPLMVNILCAPDLISNAKNLINFFGIYMNLLYFSYRVSERQISVYKVSNLSAPLNTVGLDVSPAILMIYYDEDSSTLFLTGKGDSTIYAFEITDESPFICPLSHHRSMSLHQGLSFISKNHCDVANVEFAKAYRLTNTTVEPLSFTVPRIKV